VQRPADQAFVIRFRSGTNGRAERVEGRIDHVRSGLGVRFGTSDEMLAFIRLILYDAAPTEEECP
jgi:hypothetical protein